MFSLILCFCNLVQNKFREIIFEDEGGYGFLFWGSAMTLAGGIKVVANVVDCWPTMLNCAEKKKAKSSPLRFYFPTNLLVWNKMSKINKVILIYKI